MISQYHTLFLILHCLLVHIAIAVAFVALQELVAQIAIKIVYKDVAWDYEEHIEWLLGRVLIGAIPVLGEITFALTMWEFAERVEAWALNFDKYFFADDGVMYCRCRKKLWWKREDKDDWSL